jgi:2-hydroxy-3-oxopropionate reductase
MERVGLIGLGNVGSGFAQRLREAGYPLTVLDKDRSRMEEALAQGAKPGASPREVAEQSDIVLLSLPGGHVVEAVMEGKDGLLSAARPGLLIVDTGTSHPDTDRRYATMCEERGSGLIDAPITGRNQGWIIMVGGTEAHYEKARPVLDTLSYKLAHVGPLGAGQALKLANQMILAGQLAVWAETVEFTRQAGLDPALLKDCLEFPIPDMIYGDEFHTGGHLALHYKDLGYALDLAHRDESNTPVTALVREIFKAAKAGGEPGWGQSGIVTYWRRLNERAEKD